MGIEVLGPLGIDGDGVSLQRRDQVVLSALVVRLGDEVSPDRLADAVWPERPPATWRKVVQGSVLRLRRTLGPSSIESTAGGYRLVVHGDEVDCQRFEQLVDRGRVLLAAGEFDRAAVSLGRALEMWRGPPFEVLESWPPGQIAAARLTELCRIAEESLLEARLHLGDHRDVIPMAEARVAEEPLREHRWALLALALYRCGRQADALRALKRARQTLAELGIEPGSELAALEAAILRQDESLLAPPAPPAIAEHCPYKGLAPYDVEDSDAFFGRGDEVATCLERLAENPLLVVTGPSGCGKSSLVRAGVVPALHRAGHTAVVFSPGADPAAAMATAQATCNGTPVLVVDQFEELFATADDKTTAAGFCAQLADYAIDQAPVVVAVRGDHVASLAADSSFARLAERGMHLVAPLAGESLRQAIDGPAELAGLKLEHGLVDLLVRDCEGEPGALPLLSHALAETWQRRDGRVLTVEAYRATGEIRGAVARTADRLYEGLPAEQRPTLRSLLMRLVSPTPDGEPMRSRVATRTLGSDSDRARVLGLLVHARLVTADDDSVELAHEALARAWPRLRSWLDEDAAGQRILRHLSAAAEGWDSLGRPESELYRGARLDAATEWRAAAAPDLTVEEVAFLDASSSATEHERRLAAEQAATQARQRRRHRVALASVAALLIVAVAGGVVAYQQRQATHRTQWEAEVTALASTSQALRSTRPDLAALLAVASHSMFPSAATESALFGTFTAAPGLRRVTRTDVDLRAAKVSGSFLPDGETIAIADDHGAVDLINLTDGGHQRLPALNAENAGRVVVEASVDGRLLAVLWYSFLDQSVGWLTVWDLETGERRFPPVRLATVFSSVAISADGAFVAVSGHGEMPSEVRDGATGELTSTVEAIPPLSAVTLSPAVVAFAPDGRLAVGSRAGPIRFVDPATGDELMRLDAPLGSSDSALVFDDDGITLFAVGHGGVTPFDLDAGQPRTSGAHGPRFCLSPVYSTQLGALLCLTTGGHVTAIDAAGHAVDIPNHVDTGGVCGLVVSADGATLAEVSSCDDANSMIREWHVDGSGAVAHLAYTPDTTLHAVQGYGFAGDASAIVAHVNFATVAIDPSTRDVIDEFPDAYGFVPTEDPNVVYTVYGDTTVGTYNLASDTEVARIEVGFDTEVFSTLGTLVAVGNGNAVGPNRDRYIIPIGGTLGADGVLPVVQVRVVDFEGEPTLGPLIDGTDKFDVLSFALDDRGLLMAVSPIDGLETRIERRDTTTGELVGEPAVGYRYLASSEGGTVFVTTDGRLVQVDPATLRPIGFPFGDVGLDDSLSLDNQARHVAIIGQMPQASADPDNSLQLYDVTARIQLGDPIDLGDFGPERPTAAFRTNGTELAVDTEQGIIVWDLDPAHWVDAACDVAGRNLTHAEWDQYIGDLAPYRATCPQYATD